MLPGPGGGCSARHTRHTRPTVTIKVAVGDDVNKAAAAAAAAGGGVVLLAPGRHSISDVLSLGDGVQLVGAQEPAHPFSTLSRTPAAAAAAAAIPSSAVLSFDRKPATTNKPLIALSNASSTTDRFALRHLVVSVNVATAGYVIDIGGHGVEIEGIVVTMPTDTGKQLASVASTLHMHVSLCVQAFAMLRSRLYLGSAPI